MGSMFDDNPSLVQDPPLPAEDTSPWNQNPAASRQPTPLFLIHDGGGTIFAYYCLGNLGRAVYGISNPHYPTAETWHGGIPEMARLYLKFIKSAMPPRGSGSRDLLIGGWSLGGLISLEVARLIADENKINSAGDRLNLLGIVMVDSVCPLVLTAPLLPVVQHAIQWSEHTRQETRDRVMHCFSEAMRMVREWKMPVWGEEEEEEEEENCHIGNSGNGYAGQHNKTMSTTVGSRPPPVILLRALEPVPVLENGVSRMDIHRGDKLLGWSNYRKDLITKVIEIPGHHFSIFHTEETLEATTEGIRRACLELEAMSGRV